MHTNTHTHTHTHPSLACIVNHFVAVIRNQIGEQMRAIGLAAVLQVMLTANAVRICP